MYRGVGLVVHAPATVDKRELQSAIYKRGTLSLILPYLAACDHGLDLRLEGRGLVFIVELQLRSRVIKVHTSAYPTNTCLKEGLLDHREFALWISQKTSHDLRKDHGNISAVKRSRARVVLHVCFIPSD